MDIENIEEIKNAIHYHVYSSRKRKSIRKIKKELRKQVENYYLWSSEDLICIKKLYFIGNEEVKALCELKYSNKRLSIKEIEIIELEKQIMSDVINLPLSKKSIIKF